MRFSSFQFTILIGYLAATLGLGLVYARRQRNLEEYYLAGRSAPWWAIAISIVSSDTTAVSYLGCAALVFSGDLQLFFGALCFPFSAYFVCRFFVPVLAREKLFSVYEYLARRFDDRVRLTASALFLIMRGSHLSVALYAASLVIHQVFGFSVLGSILALGGLTALYTTFGGMKAVLWTDVLQFFVLIGGLIAILACVAGAFHGDLAALWRTASQPAPRGARWLNGAVDATRHTRSIDLRFSLTAMNFWAVLISLSLQGVGSYGSDQVLVQRYLAAGSERKMARSLIAGSLVNVPVAFLLYATGAFLFAYYVRYFDSGSHEWVRTLTNSNEVMTHFMLHGLSAGLAALVIAGLFAGTMSSFSAGLNSLSAATYADFLARRLRRERSAAAQVRLAQGVTVGWGGAIIGGAACLGGKATIFELLNRAMSPFGGPLLGLFLIGMFCPRARSRDAIWGAAVGVAATFYVTYATQLHWLWYFVVGSGTSFAAGCLLGFVRRRTARNLLPHLGGYTAK